MRQGLWRFGSKDAATIDDVRSTSADGVAMGPQASCSHRLWTDHQSVLIGLRTETAA